MTNEHIAEALRAEGTISGAARALGVDRRRLSERIHADADLERLVGQGAPAGRARKEVRGNSATAESPRVPEGELPTPESLMADLDLDPDVWKVDRVACSKWGDPAAPSFQLKLWLVRKVAFEWPVLPAKHVPPVARRRASSTRPRAGEGRTTVILADPHCPYTDAPLDGLVERWLADVRPERGVFAGDVLDLPTLSTHKRNPAYAASPQECVDAGYAWTRGKVEASPSTEWDYLLGNHDARLRDYLLRTAAEAYGLRPAAKNGAPTPPESVGECVERLLHLDDLGVNVVAPARDGEYSTAEVRLARKLGVIHGRATSNTGRVTVERYGYSIVHGHDHRQAITYLTRFDEDGPKQLVAVGAGTLAVIDDGLGYADRPDWQQGFATVTEFDDGTFDVDLATYTHGALRWRGRRWTP